MKKLFIIIISFLPSFLAWGNESTSTLLLECVAIESGERIYFIKNVYEDEESKKLVNVYSVTSSKEDGQFDTEYDQKNNIRVAIDDRNFTVSTSEKKFFDMNGNVGRPDNLYTEVVKTMNYNSSQKMMIDRYQKFKRTFFRNELMSERSSAYENCVEYF